MSKDPMLEHRLRYVKDKVSITQLFRHLGFDGGDAERERQVHCPFHDDRHKSARIYPLQGQFWCWTCGVGGDTIWVVQQAKELRFVKALEWLETTFDCRYESQDWEKRFIEASKKVGKAQKAPDPSMYWEARHGLLVNAVTHIREEQGEGRAERLANVSLMGYAWDAIDDCRIEAATEDDVKAVFDWAYRMLGLCRWGDAFDGLVE